MYLGMSGSESEWLGLDRNTDIGLLGLVGLGGLVTLSVTPVGRIGMSNRITSLVSSCSRTESADRADSPALCRTGRGDLLLPTAAFLRGRFRRGSPEKGRSSPAIFSYK